MSQKLMAQSLVSLPVGKKIWMISQGEKWENCACIEVINNEQDAKKTFQEIKKNAPDICDYKEYFLEEWQREKKKDSYMMQVIDSFKCGVK